MRVEARRDEDEVGLEGAHGRLDRARERGLVLGVARAGGKREVHRRLRLVVRPARPRIERPLVERDEEHRVVVAADLLRAVAVMTIEVQDRHPFRGHAVIVIV